MPTLVYIPYSPWSRMARLALERMGVEVRRRVYTPTLDEPWLRARLGRIRGPVTVPVLLGAGAPITDSWDIVCWGADKLAGADADSADNGAAAFLPPGQRDEIRAWHLRATEALAAGRLRTTSHVLSSYPALRASLPPAIARLGPFGRVVGQRAAKRLLQKYGDGGDLGSWGAALERYCVTLSDALAGREHLRDAPSYADVAAALGLAFIAPDAHAKVPADARAAWTVPELAERHGELLAWRDRVLAP